MIKIAVVGCTGRLGSVIMNNILHRDDVELGAAIVRKGNSYAGKRVSDFLGGDCETVIVDDIELAWDCDVFIDCTNADTFMNSSYRKYEKLQKPLVIATTAFTEEDKAEINRLAQKIPVFMTGNFSIALHDFIETLKFVAKRISMDTDIQIVEYHHNQKVDAPSGTALMIKEAVISADSRIVPEKINICSIRGGNIFGEHEVIFANSKDEVMTFKHQVSSRETFAEGAVKVAVWLVGQENGMYSMDDFCGDAES